MISIDMLQQRVRNELPQADIDVTTDGYSYNFRVVDEAFTGKRPVQRQQMVYASLTDLIADGSLHALTIVAMTPAELEADA
jgi:acid stress-induced BolA-like protein IbaG/YrbA